MSREKPSTMKAQVDELWRELIGSNGTGALKRLEVVEKDVREIHKQLGGCATRDEVLNHISWCFDNDDRQDRRAEGMVKKATADRSNRIAYGALIVAGLVALPDLIELGKSLLGG